MMKETIMPGPAFWAAVAVRTKIPVPITAPVVVALRCAGHAPVVSLRLLADDWLGAGRVVVLGPRRLAAGGAAQRMVTTHREQVRRRGGFRVGMQSKVAAAARIEGVAEV